MEKNHLQVAVEAIDAEIVRLNTLRGVVSSLNGYPPSTGKKLGKPPGKGTGSGAKAYWYSMTPEQRKREMRRRIAKRKGRR